MGRRRPSVQMGLPQSFFLNLELRTLYSGKSVAAAFSEFFRLLWVGALLSGKSVSVTAVFSDLCRNLWVVPPKRVGLRVRPQGFQDTPRLLPFPIASPSPPSPPSPPDGLPDWGPFLKNVFNIFETF